MSPAARAATSSRVRTGDRKTKKKRRDAAVADDSDDEQLRLLRLILQELHKLNANISGGMAAAGFGHGQDLLRQRQEGEEKGTTADGYDSDLDDDPKPDDDSDELEYFE